ncbi:MAG: LytTR family transcriptional regulator DNA-binding domain-containing protein [Saprospiraceae bacterium]|nr:LytTR family transcriptional regulator DNA-binding domain-containing protein [Saprospiraceae bacterium]
MDITQFVRIHKSSIINIEKVKSYTSRLNGDFDVLMENGIKLRLSRNYVKLFREKMAVRNES